MKQSHNCLHLELICIMRGFIDTIIAHYYSRRGPTAKQRSSPLLLLLWTTSVGVPSASPRDYYGRMYYTVVAGFRRLCFWHELKYWGVCGSVDGPKFIPSVWSS